MSKVELISLTPDAEKTMAYIARVSNPSNQDNDKFAGLLRYCINHEHWSVFEQSCMTLKIETNRGIAVKLDTDHLPFKNSLKDMQKQIY